VTASVSRRKLRELGEVLDNVTTNHGCDGSSGLEKLASSDDYRRHKQHAVLWGAIRDLRCCQCFCLAIRESGIK